jgi:hypothetical protein
MDLYYFHTPLGYDYKCTIFLSEKFRQIMFILCMSALDMAVLLYALHKQLRITVIVSRIKRRIILIWPATAFDIFLAKVLAFSFDFTLSNSFVNPSEMISSISSTSFSYS